MKKILISDAVDKSCSEMLHNFGHDVKFQPGIKRDELLNQIHKYNALIVRSETQVDGEMLALADNLEVIGRAGAGVDNIDVNKASRKGILVMNTPGGNTISTAEHTMALLLGMCRNIAQSNQSLKSGKWDRKNFKGTEVAGKTIGIIGLGKIGREVAIRCQTFGMNIVAYDPILQSDINSSLKIRLVNLDKIWELADIITVHVPLNSETNHLISESVLSKCKNGVKIINCARGGIIDENALLKALEVGKVSAAAFDVYETEPPASENKLINHPKVLSTPHLGASTEEAQIKVAQQIALQINDYFKSGEQKGAVNSFTINNHDEKLLPYLKLAENLGSIQSQLLEGYIKELNVELNGEVLIKNSELITTAILKGFLSDRLTEVINYINAPVLAKELGILVNEKKSSVKINYSNLLTTNFFSDKNKKNIAGTVFDRNEIRVVNINNYRIDLKPEGNLLICTNIDKPGMLASISRVLAEAKINIAGLSLGRVEAGKDALTVITVDDKISNEVRNKISLLEGIKKVQSVII